MSLRDWINRHRPATDILFALLILVGVGLAFWNYNKSRDADQPGVWFYDLTAQKRVTVQTRELPPIQGGQLVRAYVYSCSSCADQATLMTGYIERYTEEAKAALAQPVDPMDMEAAAAAVEAGRQLAAVPKSGEPDWVDAMSAAGVGIRRATLRLCGGQSPKLCTP